MKYSLKDINECYIDEEDDLQIPDLMELAEINDKYDIIYTAFKLGYMTALEGTTDILSFYYLKQIVKMISRADKESVRLAYNVLKGMFERKVSR